MLPTGSFCRALHAATVLAAAAFGSTFACPAATGAGDEPATVQIDLRDGRELTGVLRLVAPSRYLVQTATDLFEVSGDEIAAVGGTPGLPAPVAASPPVIDYDTYETLEANGDVAIWSRTRIVNNGAQLMTFVSWGAAPHELEKYRTLKVFDAYGHHLPHRLVPRATGAVQDVIVDLAVPVAPNETLELSTRAVRRNAAVLRGGVWTFTFNGDFSEDRLYLRKLRLPHGAQLVQAEPPAQVFDDGARLLLIWRRYYPARQVAPLNVTYRLP